MTSQPTPSASAASAATSSASAIAHTTVATPAPAQAAPQPSGKEILNRPGEFDGSTNSLDDFLIGCRLHLLINDVVYNTDERKIAFVLSLMTKDSALAWRNTFAAKGLVSGLGTFKDFVDELTSAFQAEDPREKAVRDISSLKQDKSLRDYIAAFSTLQMKAKVTDFLIVSAWFYAGLKSSLALKCTTHVPRPDTIPTMYALATAYDNQWQDSVLKYGRTKGRTIRAMPFSPNPPPLNRLSEEDRKGLFQENKCFRCRKEGHRSRNCPQNQHSQPRKNAVEIRAMIEALPQDELEELVAADPRLKGF